MRTSDLLFIGLSYKNTKRMKELELTLVGMMPGSITDVMIIKKKTINYKAMPIPNGAKLFQY